MSNQPISYLNGYEIKDKAARETIFAHAGTIATQGETLTQHTGIIAEQGETLTQHAGELSEIKNNIERSVYIETVGTTEIDILKNWTTKTGKKVTVHYIIYSNGMKELMFDCSNDKLTYDSTMNMRIGLFLVSELPFAFNECINAQATLGLIKTVSFFNTGSNANACCGHQGEHLEFIIADSAYDGADRKISCRFIFI